MAPHIPEGIDSHLLGLYLSDHLTGATAGVSRMVRMAEAFADTPVYPEIARISAEVRVEKDRLRRLIQDLGVRRRMHRQVLAWLAERGGRLKLNGTLLRRSPMTMVLEAELMRAAVMAKLGGWQTLEELAPDLGLDPAEYAALGRNARVQIETLSRVHDYARTNAFRKKGAISR